MKIVSSMTKKVLFGFLIVVVTYGQMGAGQDNYSHQLPPGAEINRLGAEYESLAEFWRAMTDPDWLMLTDQDLQRLSLGAFFPAGSIGQSQIIFDNEEAFRTKMVAIDEAQEQIRMMYYIFQFDQTSSLLIQKLIDKARSGVKVEILVDFFTNSSRLDFFRYIQEAGGTDSVSGKPNLQIRLFNPPNREIISDLMFLTTPCSGGVDLSLNPESEQNKECAAEKREKVSRFWDNNKERIGNREYLSDLPVQTKKIIAGIYSFQLDLILDSLSYGSGIDIEELKRRFSKEDSGDEEVEEGGFLKHFSKVIQVGRILVNAKVHDQLLAKMQLQAIYLIFGDQIRPVLDLMSALLPIDKNKSYQHWLHSSDFVHHKLLSVDDNFAQLGGRNIENSYHVSSFDVGSKYLFLDVDMAIRPSVGHNLNKINQRFYKLYDNATSVIPLEQALSFMSYEGDSSKPWDQRRQEIHAEVLEKSSLCEFDTNLGFTNSPCLRSSVMNQTGKIESWNEQDITGSLSEEQNQELQVTYLENLNFLDENYNQRLFGSIDGKEAQFNKNIHLATIHSLRQVCAESRQTGEEKKVTFLQGYVIFPANILDVIGRMIRGENGWHCGPIQLNIFTNSIATTDLNVINIFALQQIKAIYDLQESYPNSKVMVRYNELHLRGVKEENKRSLHAKVNIIGDDVYIGSMNMDVRSYYMDTNNGFFLRGAQGLSQDLTRYIETLSQAHIDSNGGSDAVFRELTQEELLEVSYTQVLDFIDYWLSGIEDEETREKYRKILLESDLGDNKKFEDYIKMVFNQIHSSSLALLERSRSKKEMQKLHSLYNKLLMLF